MRELRVFDENTNKFYTPTVNYETGLLYFKTSEIISEAKGFRAETSRVFKKLDDVTINEATLVLDAKRNMIFTDDILKDTYGEGNHGRVYYAEDEGAYFLAPPDDLIVAAEDYMMLSRYSYWPEMLVIGNMSLNPELMRVKDDE